MKGCLTWIALGVAGLLAAMLVYGLYLSPTRPSAPLSPAAVKGSAFTPAPAIAFEPPPPVAAPSEACASSPAWREAAAANAASLIATDWKPFDRGEGGWEIYLPLVQREIATSCGAADEGFAESLAAWQKSRRMKPTGVMDAVTFDAMRVTWLQRRPFVKAMGKGCPAEPTPDRLAVAATTETYGGKEVKLRPAALKAWRDMIEAARREEPALAKDTQALKLLSGYRDPLSDGIRCMLSNDCGVARAPCSAHRTGLAVDLYLGNAPGKDPASTEDANRLWQSRTAAYRWLVRNADRFGFVNYPYEPWHWEWTGEGVE